MLLEAKNIGYHYPNGPWVLKNVDIEVKQGEIVGIMAPSGYGKTTLGRILSGYLNPNEGEVLLDGSPISQKGYNPVQLIFQHPEKTLNGRWRMKDSLNEGWKVDKDTLKSLGIKKEWLRRWPNELSGGELQRFCIARALGPDTKFLIADEISTMLDSITQAQIWNVILDTVKDRNLGVFVISHEKSLMERLCTRIVDLTILNKR